MRPQEPQSSLALQQGRQSRPEEVPIPNTKKKVHHCRRFSSALVSRRGPLPCRRHICFLYTRGACTAPDCADRINNQSSTRHRVNEEDAGDAIVNRCPSRTTLASHIQSLGNAMTL